MRAFMKLAVAMLVLTAAGCDEKNSPAPTPPDSSAVTASTEEPGHAPADAEPGSHEDWCVEHAIPESMCTRCNASLTAAFKATGDWCEEHALPESQCLLCNPELKIVRPPKTAGK